MLREVSGPLPVSKYPAEGPGGEEDKVDGGCGIRQEMLGLKRTVFCPFPFSETISAVWFSLCVHGCKQGSSTFQPQAFCTSQVLRMVHTSEVTEGFLVPFFGCHRRLGLPLETYVAVWTLEPVFFIKQ